MILRCEHRPIGTGSLLMLSLHCRRCQVGFIRSGLFSRCWLRSYTTGSAVIAGTIHGRRVVHYGGVVGIVDDGGVHIRHRGVVVVGATDPLTAVESGANVAKSVVNTAVKSHVRSPVSGVPKISSAAPAPIARGP